MQEHEIYMTRCLELALNGLGSASPNPMVGSVIVHGDKVIGEGYHRQYGGPHAEVNAIASISDKSLLQQSTLYVNLEPCAHWGKTPPCANLILEKRIPRVVIGSRDPFPQVNGKGIELLQNAGVGVTVGVLEQESLFLNRRFFSFHTRQRPYIILKWAQTRDGLVARTDFTSQWISSPYSRLLSHKWRGNEAAILVGTNTGIYDNPRLTARDMSYKDPLRILIDRSARVPASHHLLDGSVPTWVFTQTPAEDRENVRYIITDFDAQPIAEQVCAVLYKEGIQSLIVEGGSQVLDHFLQQNLWDEARVIRSSNVFGSGIAAPALPFASDEHYTLGPDELDIYYRKGNSVIS